MSTQANSIRVRDTLPTPSQLADSLIFSDKLQWSIRLVSNFKQQQFRLRNGDNRLIYKPNNPFGLGFGVANDKIVIDVLFNIKTGEDDHTEKFAAEGSLIVKKRNLLSFTFENVHGYQVTSKQTDTDDFRDDITMFSLGLEYLRLLSKHEITVRGMKAGLSDSRSSFLSYGIGGFILLKSLDADASIIPDSDRPYFNEEANIYDMEGFGAGLLAGVSGYFNLPGDFFATAYIAPGIGLDYKYVKSEAGNYRPTNPMIYKTDLFGSLGYNRKRFYVHFTFGTDLYLTSLDYSNQVFLSVTKSKFIIGYNLGK